MEIKLTRFHSFSRKWILQTVMRTFIFLLCTTVFGFTTNNGLAQEKVKIEQDKIFSVDEVFEMIINQTKYSFLYPADLFKDAPKVNLQKGIVSVGKLLQQTLPKNQFNIVLGLQNRITIKKKNKLQQRQISGKITDSSGEPLPNVTVRIKGTNKATASDFNGVYNIVISDNVNVLVFTSIGFETQEIAVDNQTTINITLKEAVGQLDEIVINAGYYKVKDKERTGSIAKIEAKDIEKQPANNPLAAIQGRLSGVNIVQNSGVSGGGFTIEIRGQNFINGSTNPLFIVDGVPFGAESLESFQVGGQINQGNISPLNAINTQDIESIEVLKDADATAIYGSRGANGVVLITTKKGKIGKTQFKASFTTTLSNVNHTRNLMNTEQYLEVRREGIEGDGYGSYLTNPDFDFVWPDVKSWEQDRYTDWQKELIGGTAYRNNAQISISGGSEQTQFLISGAHQSETTVFPGDSKYKKYSIHSNINHKSKDNRFQLNFSSNYTIEDNKLPRSDLTSLAYSIEPNAPAIYDDEGNINWENNSFDNPIATLDNEYQVNINTLISNMVLSYKIATNLEIKTSLGYNSTNLNSYQTLPSTARNPSFGFTSRNYSSIITNTSKRDSWIIEPQINWNLKLNDLKFDVLFGSTFQRESTKQYVERGKGFSSNKLILNISAAETLEALQDSDSEYSYQAFYGRINLNFKNKYILNLTGRRDGSSRFGPGKQFGNFGAIGATWIFSKEEFLKNNNVISFGKFRTSYGTTGSDNIGDYRFLDTYNVSGNDYNGISTLEPTGIFNPLLAWEENKKFEAALELGLFKERIFLTTAWFQNRSSNQLIGIPLAATTGFNSLDGNFDATVQNTGLEVELNTINIKSENFNWTTSFNLTVPRNELLKFDGIETSTFANSYKVGKSLNIIHFYHAIGVDPTTGIYTVEDFNQDGKIDRVDDRQIIKDMTPEFYGGLANNITYKNFSLDFIFQFKKQLGFNFLRSDPTPGPRRNGPVELYTERWQQAGDIATVQQSTAGLNFANGIGFAGNNYSESDATLTDASFIRLRSISLNYNIPKKLTSNMDLNVYIQGQNLFTITNYKYRDPEQVSNSRLPQLRQITLGINLTF